MTFERFDVVVVPFPFTDRQTTKHRPAVALSSRDGFNEPCGHVVLAMVTSARHSSWVLDVPIQDLRSAGLPSASVIRMKLFTLDARLVERRAGRLGEQDAHAARRALSKLLAIGE